MRNDRRKFLKLLGGSGIAASLPLADLFRFNSAGPDEGFVITEDDQEVYLIGPRRAPVTIILDGAKGAKSACLCREEIRPGDGIPVHKHLNEDELIYIQYGTGLFTLGDKQFPVKAGSAAFVPKGIWHGIANSGTADLRMVFSYTPGGFENYFREIGVPKNGGLPGKTEIDWEGINKKYGIVYRR